ncbi:uncharacterized protein STEHIDRAFT_148106 [Stereum hirsutum FP-91666 SS1]|uniref:uncharacterized protein n=1 Tax=Stereum hirsutum (strain FP-91666) TaxID=721885 RepID=UPI0004449724|nr:uncharacterized protein STEHIDRAFT_148106 [Stereum hirsutum FP-91666 SS1]EIM84788.1 hypothetical protein STEHIDRAFT_148106 [Stereum hirsutum FP-91666 SS1]
MFGGWSAHIVVSSPFGHRAMRARKSSVSRSCALLRASCDPDSSSVWYFGLASTAHPHFAKARCLSRFERPHFSRKFISSSLELIASSALF